jgi:uncharacterized SAM-binding protein YcdF (DUF218 family)
VSAILLIVKRLLLPPGGFLLVALALAWLGARRRRAPRLGWALLFLAVTVLCLPVTGRWLLAGLESYPALAWATGAPPSASRGVGAIVVLGAGRARRAAEYGGADTVSGTALERLRYGVLWQRRTGLPLLVSGGDPLGEGGPEADLMAAAAAEWGVDPAQIWREGGSPNTADNARLSAALLARHGIRRVLLVTHAAHMRRAVATFQAAGLAVVPAPLGFHGAAAAGPGVVDYLPSLHGLAMSTEALYEGLGWWWYRLRGWVRAEDGA